MNKAATAIKSGKFNGFPLKTLTFLRGIKRNNNQEWFEARRSQYENYFVTPAQQFVMELGPKLQKISPGISFDPDHNGKGSIKKIFTDRRFNPARQPYKPWLDVIFWEGPLKAKKDNSVYSVRIEPEKLVLAAGLKHMDGPVLKAYRHNVGETKRGAELASVLESVLQDVEYTLEGEHFKKVPQGFDPAHPQAALLKHNALYVKLALPLPQQVHAAQLVDFVLGHFKKMEPVHSWCADMLDSSNLK